MKKKVFGVETGTEESESHRPHRLSPSVQADQEQVQEWVALEEAGEAPSEEAGEAPFL